MMLLEAIRVEHGEGAEKAKTHILRKKRRTDFFN
jgi:hypothetical protein